MCYLGKASLQILAIESVRQSNNSILFYYYYYTRQFIQRRMYILEVLQGRSAGQGRHPRAVVYANGCIV